MINKIEIRKNYLRKRNKQDKKISLDENKTILKCLINDEDYIKSKTIFTYYSVDSEVDTKDIIKISLALNKKVYIPKCFKNNRMEAYRIDCITNVKNGVFNIPEPLPDAEKILPERLDLCIVPGICFSKNLYRLGYGGGFYDRFLPRTNATKIGLCFSEFLLDDLPHDKHDIKCDKLLIGNGMKIV